jgi:hypothetical protein
VQIGENENAQPNKLAVFRSVNPNSVMRGDGQFPPNIDGDGQSQLGMWTAFWALSHNCG